MTNAQRHGTRITGGSPPAAPIETWQVVTDVDIGVLAENTTADAHLATSVNTIPSWGNLDVSGYPSVDPGTYLISTMTNMEILAAGGFQYGLFDNAGVVNVILPINLPLSDQTSGNIVLTATGKYTFPGILLRVFLFNVSVAGLNNFAGFGTTMFITRLSSA